MNNRKSKIFLTLILGTKGKYLPKQKTQQVFLSSSKPVPPHPSCTEQEGHRRAGAGIQAGHREGVAAGCGPAEGPAALFCLAFPSADVPAAAWLSPSLLLAFQIWFETGQRVQKLFRHRGKLERHAQQLELLSESYFLRKLC